MACGCSWVTWVSAGLLCIGELELLIQYAAVDSWEAKGAGEPFVRNAGFDEAWDKVEDRPRAQL